ncbi:glycosyltransferase family 2 protein [Patescibacteria group bacterium]|nr:glycosyltransferase family 2 protein [Patescibacteria group bacterium]MBU4162273.1 glycosyltransferase family 2 protein [Patescibacteria group bacterium]
MKISFIIPIYNESGNIPELYRRLKKAIESDFRDFDYEIIFVDDGSNDNSFDLIEGLHNQNTKVKAIKFSRNFGHHIAITAGLDIAVGDFVVMMDGDLQDQPEEIIKLWNKLQQGYDVVYAQRKNKKFGYFKKVTSKLFNFLIKKLIDEDIEINSSIFRIMTKEVVEKIKELRESNRYIIGLIGWVGFKHIAQEVEHGERFKGKGKYDINRQFKLALNAIFSFSTIPIKIITRIGLLFILFSLFLAIYILIKKFIYCSIIAGLTYAILLIFFVGGIQIIAIGIIGEYIVRTYAEARRRPLYIIKDKLI